MSTIEFEKKFTLGNLITLFGMVLTVGSVYGIQTMMNNQARKDIDRNSNDIPLQREQITTLREAQMVLTYDVRAIKSMVTEVRDEQKSLAKDIRDRPKTN